MKCSPQHLQARRGEGGEPGCSLFPPLQVREHVREGSQVGLWKSFHRGIQVGISGSYPGRNVFLRGEQTRSVGIEKVLFHRSTDSIQTARRQSLHWKYVEERTWQDMCHACGGFWENPAGQQAGRSAPLMSVTVRTQYAPIDRKTDGSSCSEFHNKLPRHLPEVAVQVKHVTCSLKLQRHGNGRR